MRSDWLHKLQISFDIHLRERRAGFAPENIVFVVGINDLKLSFLLYYLIVLVILKQLIISVPVGSVRYLTYRIAAR